jgi:hypothetical protein
MVQQQLDQLSVIGRCEYGKTCQLLVQLFDQAAQAYQEMINNINTAKLEITIQEGRAHLICFDYITQFPPLSRHRRVLGGFASH